MEEEKVDIIDNHHAVEYVNINDVALLEDELRE